MLLARFEVRLVTIFLFTYLQLSDLPVIYLELLSVFIYHSIFFAVVSRTIRISEW